MEGELAIGLWRGYDLTPRGYRYDLLPCYITIFDCVSVVCSGSKR